MPEPELDTRHFYQMESGRVVRPRTITPEFLTLVDPEDGTIWTVRRGPFEAHLEEGFIERVTPNWEPAAAVTV